MCILLERLAYPVRWASLEACYGRSASGLSNIFLYTLQYLEERYTDLLYFDFDWIAPRLEEFAFQIESKGAMIVNVWAFIDGTVRAVCRPYDIATVGYNGHKRLHSMNFQTITTPDGIIPHVFGPYRGFDHDIRMPLF